MRHNRSTTTYKHRDATRSKIKPAVVLLNLLLIIDGIPFFYEVVKDGLRFMWEPKVPDDIPETENNLLPAFIIWREDNQWVLETDFDTEIDTNLIAQVMQRCERFFKSGAAVDRLD